jgi:capsular exopolysaccharide synthesis family protein
MNENNEVKLHFLDYWRVIRQRIGLILLTFFLVVITAAIYIFFLPKEYFSKVTMEIKPDNNKAVDPLNYGAASRTDPQFISTQFEILQKNEILFDVIDRLNLVKAMSPPGQSYPKNMISRLLVGSMSVQEKRNTSLIEVGVYNTDKLLAKDIAQTIAYVYKDKRIKDLKTNVEHTLEEMKDELRKTEELVRQLYKEAAEIRQQEKILDPDPESINVIVALEDRPVQMNEEQLVKQRALVEQLENQYNQIKELKPEELREALRALGIDDPTVVKNLGYLQDANAEEAKMLSSGVGENHPRMKALKAQAEVYRRQLTEQHDSIVRAQKTKLDIEKAQLASNESTYTKLKEESIREKSRTQRYVEKKSEYLLKKALMQVIEQRYAAARFDNALSVEPVKIWENAEVSYVPDKPRVATYLVVAAFIGLIAGVGLAFFIEYLDTSVKTLEDIERYLSLPVLAVIPKDIAVLMRQKRDSADAEAYRILKANIEFNLPEREANTFTLVSGGPGEGKSTTLNNLAFTYAKGGANVLVVDADLRRPSQQRFFDVDNSVGLADYLHGKAKLEDIVKGSKLDNLSFIPSGRLADDAGIVNSPRMKELIALLKRQYDVVFFDSPPILGVSDASVLVSEVDNTIMVVQHRRFPRGMLQRVKHSVGHVGGNLIGVVLNNVDTKQDDSYQYYSSYNDYYAPRRERAEPNKKPVTAGAKADEEEY